MIVPQLYLNGRCNQAIKIYEKVFSTKIDSILFDKDKKIL